MTATMVAAALPMSVNAVVDTSKKFTLNTVDMTDLSKGGNTYTVSAEEIAAGDVKITCGLYLEETTEAECAGILSTFGISDKSVSTSDISIAPTCLDLNKEYFTEARTFTTSEGTTFTTKMLPAFSGTFFRGKYAFNSTDFVCDYSETRKTMDGEVSLPSIAFNWTAIKGSVWTGATSDEYPMYYFDVTLKKDAKPGKYVIDFYDYLKSQYQCSNQIGSTTLNYEYTALLQSQTGEGLIEFGAPLEITVAGGGEESSSSSTTTSTSTSSTTTTTTTSGNQPIGQGIELSYKYEEGDCYKAEAGDEVYADLMINSNGNAIFSFDTKYIIDDALEITNVYDVSDAFSCGLTVNWAANATEQLVDSKGNPVDAKVNSVVAIVNDR